MAIDIMLVIFAALGFYMGFSRGIISTVFTVLSYTLGVVAALKFAPGMTKLLEDVFGSTNPLMFVVGLILSFVITMMLIRLVARGLEGLLETAQINIVNQVLGGALLSAIMILVYSLGLWFADQSNMVNNEAKTESISYPFLKEFPSQVWAATENLKPTFRDFWNHSLDFMDKLEDMTMEKTESDPTIYDIPDEEKE